MVNVAVEARTILEGLGISDPVVSELLSYNDSPWKLAAQEVNREPMSEEAHLPVWRGYAAECSQHADIRSLATYFPQMEFPIREGVSKDAEYIRKTRGGGSLVERRAACELHLNLPDQCRIAVHPTAAGAIPIIEISDREDFEVLVQAFAHRNEPVPIPNSMGACIVAGYNNWHRIRLELNRYLRSGGDASGWSEEFKRLRLDKSRYQDTFILLSAGPYSAVAAEELSLAETEWTRLSGTIRREHECTHYVTRRLLGSMSNNVLDELIADFFGIYAACGEYRSSWMLQFFGLESSDYRRSSRLENYRGSPPLSDAAFLALQELLRRAVVQLDDFAKHHLSGPILPIDQIAFLYAISGMRLEHLTDRAGSQELGLRYREKQRLLSTPMGSAVAEMHQGD